MKRIDPAQAPKLFPPDEMMAIRGKYIDKGFAPCGACLVGAVAIAEMGRNRATMTIMLASELASEAGFDYDYLAGLSGGWEYDAHAHLSASRSRESYLAGYDDGRTARQACIEAGIGIFQAR